MSKVGTDILVSPLRPYHRPTRLCPTVYICTIAIQFKAEGKAGYMSKSSSQFDITMRLYLRPSLYPRLSTLLILFLVYPVTKPRNVCSRCLMSPQYRYSQSNKQTKQYNQTNKHNNKHKTIKTHLLIHPQKTTPSTQYNH